MNTVIQTNEALVLQKFVKRSIPHTQGQFFQINIIMLIRCDGAFIYTNITNGYPKL